MIEKANRRVSFILMTASIPDLMSLFLLTSFPVDIEKNSQKYQNTSENVITFLIIFSFLMLGVYFSISLLGNANLFVKFS